jgi:hypothetical protein
MVKMAPTFPHISIAGYTLLSSYYTPRNFSKGLVFFLGLRSTWTKADEKCSEQLP